MGVRGARQRSVGVSTLLANHRAPAVHRAPVRQGCLHVGVAHPREVEHVARELARQLNNVGGPTTGEYLDGLLYLEGVSDLAPQRHRHVGEEGARGHPRVTSEVNHRAGKLARSVQVLHEGSRPDLDVQDEGSRALGDLLAHDGAGDQRDRLDGRGNVAQGVELLVRGCQARSRRADDRAAALPQLGHDLVVTQLRTPPGDRLQLVEGAARVPQAPARQLRDRDTEARNQRGQGQRDLVSHTARGVLVGGRLADAGEVHARARADHRVRPAGDLAPVHAAQENRHGQGGHLLVLDDALRVGVDRPVDLVGGQHSPVALNADDVNGIKESHGVLLSLPTRLGPPGRGSTGRGVQTRRAAPRSWARRRQA